MRRTYGAMLIEAGVDIYTVSRLLGHADVRITQEVYAPLCGKFLAQEASKLGRHIGRVLIREVPAVPELAESTRTALASDATPTQPQQTRGTKKALAQE